MPDIIVGKKKIIEFFREHYNFHSWDTFRNWKRKGMPVRYLESHAPFIIPSEIKQWAIRFDELTKRQIQK